MNKIEKIECSKIDQCCEILCQIIDLNFVNNPIKRSECVWGQTFQFTALIRPFCLYILAALNVVLSSVRQFQDILHSDVYALQTNKQNEHKKKDL